MIKYIIIFIVGLIETFLWVAYLISVNKKQVKMSSILMTFYMSIYLGIISYAIKDTDTFLMIIVYSISCGCGNYLRMRMERK